MLLTLFGVIAVEYAIDGQYFEIGGFVECRIQGAFWGGLRNIPFTGKKCLRKVKAPRKLLAYLWGVFYVFHMNFEQSSCIQILVVDDHSSMREAVTELLNREDGFEVCAQAASSHEAVQLAEHLNPDIVVMDVSMPEMDGIEATTLIRQSQPDAKIIALSVHDNEFLRNRMHAAGAAAYISKDALAGELIQAIRQFM